VGAAGGAGAVLPERATAAASFCNLRQQPTRQAKQPVSKLDYDGSRVFSFHNCENVFQRIQPCMYLLLSFVSKPHRYQEIPMTVATKRNATALTGIRLEKRLCHYRRAWNIAHNPNPACRRASPFQTSEER
jgi:hypothetical protein